MNIHITIFWGGPFSTFRCGPNLQLDFYFSNYIGPHGNVIYGVPPWTYQGDSIADLGRLVDIYLRAIRLCRPTPQWEQRLLPAVLRVGTLILTMQKGVPGNTHLRSFLFFFLKSTNLLLPRWCMPSLRRFLKC
jgi:hypothetical protein